MGMQATASPRKPSSDTYTKVFDSRKHRVRGLWQRNGRFFANLTVADDLGAKTSRMVPLNGATLSEAMDDYRKLQVERTEDRLRPLGQTPMLSDYITTAFTPQLRASGKRDTTITKESGYARFWQRKLGHLRLNKIRTHHLKSVLTDLATDGYSPRGVNLHLIAIRAVLKSAHQDGHIKLPLPFEGLKWQPVENKKRELTTPAEMDLLCDLALRASKHGRQFADYLRFLQYSGARMREALSVRWQSVDFDRHQVTIGADGDSKNRESRVVDFNAALAAHLDEMRQRRQPASQWLFPSPHRGDQDIHAQTYRESLDLTRLADGVECLDCHRLTPGSDAAQCACCGSVRVERRERLLPPKLQRFGFHDARHHFISYAVMSGVDFMTIAKWVGHKDGGVLIGKVYGHLADEHRRQMAQQVSFGPRLVAMPQTATIAAPALVQTVP
jgi:integrase